MRKPDSLIHELARRSHDAGQLAMLDRVVSSIGRNLVGALLPEVFKAYAPQSASPAPQPEPPDPHAALLVAQLDHLLRCAHDRRDHRPGDARLHALWDEPDRLESVLRNAFGAPAKTVRKDYVPLVVKAAKKAPKGGVTLTSKTSNVSQFYAGGQWIPAAAVADATPESQAALGAKPDDKKSVRSAAPAAAPRDTSRRKVAEIASQILKDPKAATPDTFRDLAESVVAAYDAGHLSVTDLRALRLKVAAAFTGGAPTSEMHRTVGALIDYAESGARELEAGGASSLGGRTEAAPNQGAAAPAEGEPEGSSPNEEAAPQKPVVSNTGDPGTYAELPTSDLSIDPARFQFKLKTNAEGVTQELASVKQFNPDFAGVIAVWKDPADGKTYVVNGHHRFELARRTGHPSLLVRYLDAKDAREARAKGALINIAEGRGTAIDAAKFLRDSGRTAQDLYDLGVSPDGALARDAGVLTRLNDAAFERLARGGMELGTALAVAKHVADPVRQEKLFKLLGKKAEEGKEYPNRQIEEMARQMEAAPAATATESTLWGDESTDEDTFIERADLASHVRGALAKEFNDFSALSSERRAEATRGAGNVIRTKKNAQLAAEADVNRRAFDTLAHRKGAVSDALDAGAVALKGAKTRTEKERVRAETLEAARRAVAAIARGEQPPEPAGVGGVGPGGDAGGAGGGAVGAGADPADGVGRGAEQTGVAPAPEGGAGAETSSPNGAIGVQEEPAAPEPEDTPAPQPEPTPEPAEAAVAPEAAEPAREVSSPNDKLAELAAGAIPRADLQKTHRNLSKYADLHDQGYSISHWLNPSDPQDQVLEYNPRAAAGETNTRPRLTARDGDELAAIHDALGVPVPPERARKTPPPDENGFGRRTRGRNAGPPAPKVPRPKSHKAELHRAAVEAGKDITQTPEMDAVELARAAHAANPQLPTAGAPPESVRKFADDITKIPARNSAWVGGHRVRALGDGRFQVERKGERDWAHGGELRGGFLTGTADQVAQRIAESWADQEGFASLGPALARAEAYDEPDPFTDVKRADGDAALRAAVPDGSRAVSLDDNTKGRIGVVRRDPKTGAAHLQLDGGEETRATDFEPLDVQHSWRASPEERAAAKPKGGETGDLFDNEPDNLFSEGSEAGPGGSSPNESEQPSVADVVAAPEKFARPDEPSPEALRRAKAAVDSNDYQTVREVDRRLAQNARDIEHFNEYGDKFRVAALTEEARLLREKRAELAASEPEPVREESQAPRPLGRADDAAPTDDEFAAASRPANPQRPASGETPSLGRRLHDRLREGAEKVSWEGVSKVRELLDRTATDPDAAVPELRESLRDALNKRSWEGASRAYGALADADDAAKTTTPEPSSPNVPEGSVSPATAKTVAARTDGEPAGAAQPQSSKPPHVALADTLAERLKAGALEKNELWKHADSHFGGTRAEGKYGPSDAYDALEAGMNKSLAGQTDPTADLASAQEQARHLEELVNALPTQTNRSGNKESHQQFSTPPHYAFAANWVANLKPTDSVLEPSAGTGSLAVHAKNAGAAVHTNELDPRRADFLKDQFGAGNTHVENAEQIAGILPKRGVKPSVVVMNPPFSQTAGRMGDKKELMTGARHIAEAGRTLAPGGRLVAIVGGGTARGDATRGAGMSPGAPTYTKWFNQMAKDGFTLRANVGVEGGEYRKYGTNFPTRLLVFDKVPPTADSPAPVLGDSKDIPDLLAKLEGVRNDRPELAQPAPGEPVRGRLPEVAEGADGPGAAAAPDAGAGVAPAGEAAQPAVAGVPDGVARRGRAGRGRRPAVGDVPLGTGVRDVSPEVQGPAEGGAGAPALGATERPDAGADAPADGDVGGSGAGGEPVQQHAAGVRRLRPPELIPIEAVEPEGSEPGSEESLYADYQPARLRVPGSKPHASRLVETAAMAAVNPPVPTYRPHLSPDVVAHDVREVKNPDGTKSKKQIGVSQAALESIVYAGQAHQQFLPAAEGQEPQRRGYFIGDGTGCIAAGTKIFNPLTGSHTPVEELLRRGRPHTVLALTPNGFAPFTAEVPYLKGREELYRVTTESGRQVTVTARHRFLTPEGWTRIVDGLAAGHSLASAEDLPSCISASDRSVRDASVPRSSRTIPSCPDRCSTCSCRGGGRLRSAEGTDRSCSPSPADVLERIRQRSRTDGHWLSPERTRLRQRFDRRSRSSFSPFWSRDRVLIANPCGAVSSQLSADSPRVGSRSRSLTTFGQLGAREVVRQLALRAAGWLLSRRAEELVPLVESASHGKRLSDTFAQHHYNSFRIDSRQQSAGEFPDSAGSCDCSCGFYSRWDRIRSIEFVGVADYYDFGVPGPENYVAEGLVHHNSGKGRQIAGIILDNKNQGRPKHVWISEKDKLFHDAKRDWADMGEDPADIVHFDKLQKGDFKAKDGVVFATYDKLRGGPRDATKPRNYQRLIDWLGKDFDGVIALDESHNLGNADDTPGPRGVVKASQKAQAIMDMQRALPKARVVYVSATGATKPENLAYADRLGLWGRGTPFTDKKDFLAQMHAGGTSAMEAVAQSLKARGLYNARSLSYDGVKTDRLAHHLTDEQKYVYDNLAEAWQAVHQNIEKAIEHIAGGKENVRHAGMVKGAATGRFQSAQQQFFNQVITSMMVPTVIKHMEKDLAEGRSPVVQLTRTMQSALTKALAGREEGEDLEEIDVSPKQTLIDYLNKSFPVHRLEKVVDENDNVRMKVATDSTGRPIEDPAAVAMRDELITRANDLHIPQSPLDQIVNHFGHENVAEATGRTDRLVNKPDENGVLRLTHEKREPKVANEAEARAFQGGKKKVLVFSEAGGTGASYHADNNAKNRAQRSHYLLQPGWRADKAVQGLGRTHRTNQASAPIFHLLEAPEIPGQKRFVSTIAKRLGQLGALTRGQAQTGGGVELFNAGDNLESNEAQAGLEAFLNSLKRGGTTVNGQGYHELMPKLGFKVDNDAGGGGYRTRGQSEVPEMRQFLNRVLALKLADQQEVFRQLDDAIASKTDQARAEGTLDTGVERFPADKVSRAEPDRTVYRDPETGAEANLVKTKVTRKAHRRAWAENTKGKLPLRFVRNARSGRVWAVYDAAPKTEARSGNIVPMYTLRGPGGEQHLPASHVDNQSYHRSGYDDIGHEEAKKLWDEHHSQLPETVDSDEHFVTGDLLSVWDKLPQEKPKIYRVPLADGKSIVGRHVPEHKLESTLKALGATQKLKEGGAETSAAEVHSQVARGATANLANGWRLKPALVGGERRVELEGPIGLHKKQLQEDGVILEKIAHKERYFVPTGENGAKVLERVMRSRSAPVVGVTPAPRG